ncbi:MAG: hypothetical protein RLZZ628_1810 [Bacteroidota bacterium]|jgi:flavin reductase (DIM6/NTAB) family NADH-FMN oxidoreductase RutF
MLSIDPIHTDPTTMYQYLIGSVAPRPIAFVSTINAAGETNVAPFSFFNAFSGNPPMVGFSSSGIKSDGTAKDTLLNVKTLGECVINVVNYNMVQQTSLSAIEFAHGVSEFTKTGLTPIPSEVVKPPRVLESPVQMECKVEQIIKLGNTPSAGNLVICRIIRMHINPDILDVNGRIDPHKIDLMGRLGRAYYTRSSSDVQAIVRPYKPIPIGYDALPASLRASNVLTGNNLAQLGSLIQLPTRNEILETKENDNRIKKILVSNNITEGLHLYAREILTKGDTFHAAKIALLADEI